MAQVEKREVWGTRLGLILAAAGNAVGIGNLLRFPGQAATNGGGAFMIPYFVCLLVFGIPMMWVAWTIGRHGGRFGHGSLPGMFDRMWNSRAAKYVGVLGLALPFCFVLYYTYIEAWCLAYSWFSFHGDYISQAGRHVDLNAYYNEFMNVAPTHSYFPGLKMAFTFMAITFALNIFVLYRGVTRGIELLAKIAMPLLFVFCALLAIRVLTLKGEGTALQGLNFLWTPDFSRLGDANVWLAAAGQIFFTLSIGFGSLECYASYLRQNDDVALTGLTTASANEFVEVVFGSMIAIPAAAVFFGVAGIQAVAGGGTFNIGMISMPEILRSFPYPAFFGTIWFLLLFFAAFTSSVAVAQPVVAFFQDELKLSRGRAVTVLAFMWAVGTLPVVAFQRYGFLNDLDFWAGTLGLVVMSLVEIILFAWIFGMRRGWDELQRGALMRVPGFFKFVMKYVTPIALVVVLFAFFWGPVVQQGVLRPRPSLTVWMAQPHLIQGSLRSDAPDEANREAADTFEQALGKRVSEAGAEGTIELSVAIGVDGALGVESARGTGSLTGDVDTAALQSFLQGRGYRFKTLAGTIAPGRASILVYVVHTAPYIWLARGVICASILIFLILIAVAWRRRGAPEVAA